MNEEYNLHPYHNHEDGLMNIKVTSVMIDHLRATKPWVKFLSILMFISVGLMFLGGLVMMVSFSAPAGMRGAAFGPILGIIYWIFGGLYLAPAYFLFRFASSIDDLLKGGGDVAMEMALGSQKSFWRFIGITTLVVVSFYILFIVLAIGGAMSMRSF
ncbi:MAG: hypothetical protein AAB336_01840 [Acidobacteriota bacterium]